MNELYEPALGWDHPAAGRCRPGLAQLRAWILTMWPGTTNLGCYSDRPVTGTTATPSLHRDGRAIDIGTPSADVAADITTTLAGGAEQLGIQMVLDYRNGRRWRLPYNLGDPAAGWGPWHKPGHWLHIERTNHGADDGRAIHDYFWRPEPTNPPKEHDVRNTVAHGTTGLLVTWVQSALKTGWPALDVDGIFGPKTAEIVRRFQHANKLPVDGVVDDDDWPVIDVLANRTTGP